MALKLRHYSDLSRHIKVPQNAIYCLNLFKKWQNLKAKTSFHSKSNLLCLVCQPVFSFLCAARFFTWCVAWERHGLLDVATVTKGAGLCEGSIQAPKTFRLVQLMQGCPILLLKVHCPAEFSSNPNFTWIKVIRLTRIFKAGMLGQIDF